MSLNIELFKKNKDDHDEMVELIKASELPENSQHLHYARVEDIYHVVAFSFNIKNGDHRYETSNRLAEYIGKSCDTLMKSILNGAIIESEKNLREMKDDVLKDIDDVVKFFDDKK